MLFAVEIEVSRFGNIGSGRGTEGSEGVRTKRNPEGVRPKPRPLGVRSAGATFVTPMPSDPAFTVSSGVTRCPVPVRFDPTGHRLPCRLPSRARRPLRDPSRLAAVWSIRSRPGLPRAHLASRSGERDADRSLDRSRVPSGPFGDRRSVGFPSMRRPVPRGRSSEPKPLERAERYVPAPGTSTGIRVCFSRGRWSFRSSRPQRTTRVWSVSYPTRIVTS